MSETTTTTPTRSTTRSDIIDAVAEIVGTKSQAREVVETVVTTINRGLVEDGRVHIAGLGTFQATVVPSRMVRNPSTGAKVRAKKTGRVRFRPSLATREFVAGRKKVPAKKKTKTATKRP